MDKNETVANVKQLEQNASDEATAFLAKYPSVDERDAIRAGTQISS